MRGNYPDSLTVSAVTWSREQTWQYPHLWQCALKLRCFRREIGRGMKDHHRSCEHTIAKTSSTFFFFQKLIVPSKNIFFRLHNSPSLPKHLNFKVHFKVFFRFLFFNLPHGLGARFREGHAPSCVWQGQTHMGGFWRSLRWPGVGSRHDSTRTSDNVP